MTTQLKNSQIAEQYVYSTYPCIQSWILFVQNVMPYLSNYVPVSCSQISLISQAAMKTFDYITLNEPNSKVIRVNRMLCDMYDSAWKTWVTFNAQARRSTGSRSITLTSSSLQGITAFSSWDHALDTSPSFSPPVLLQTILGGVTV